MSKLKELFLYYIVPIGILLATVWAMMTKNQRLKDEVDRHKAEKKFDKALQKKVAAEKKADKLDKEFQDAYNHYTTLLQSHRSKRDS